MSLAPAQGPSMCGMCGGCKCWERRLPECLAGRHSACWVHAGALGPEGLAGQFCAWEWWVLSRGLPA